MRELLGLFDRRRKLIILKREKLKEDYGRRLDSMRRYSSEELAEFTGSSPDPDIRAVNSQIKTMQKLKKSLHSINKENNLPDRIRLEKSNSSAFWQTNKKLEAEIDLSLQKLKELDAKTEKLAGEEFQICRDIDEVEERIKDLLVSRTPDHVRKAEPLYRDKEVKHNVLQSKQVEREEAKEDKVKNIERMMILLEKLKNHREERLRTLSELVGIPEPIDFGAKLACYEEMSDQLERIVRSKESLGKLDEEESNVETQLNAFGEAIRDLVEELTTKFSEEAKTFNLLNQNYRERLKIFTFEKVLSTEVLPDLSAAQLRELSRKVKDYRGFLGELSGEEGQVRQALHRTDETLTIFKNILLAIKSEKERKQELLRYLEQIAKINGEEAHMKERIRELQLEIEKKKQMTRHYEEDLAGIVSEANLEEFKKISSEINSNHGEQARLEGEVQRATVRLQEYRKEVLNIMEIIREDFDDIMKEVMQSEWYSSHDVKREEDLRSLRTYLKKTLKRLGI